MYVIIIVIIGHSHGVQVLHSLVITVEEERQQLVGDANAKQITKGGGGGGGQ